MQHTSPPLPESILSGHKSAVETSETRRSVTDALTANKPIERRQRRDFPHSVYRAHRSPPRKKALRPQAARPDAASPQTKSRASILRGRLAAGSYEATEFNCGCRLGGATAQVAAYRHGHRTVAPTATKVGVLRRSRQGVPNGLVSKYGTVSSPPNSTRHRSLAAFFIAMIVIEMLLVHFADFRAARPK